MTLLIFRDIFSVVWMDPDAFKSLALEFYVYDGLLLAKTI